MCKEQKTGDIIKFDSRGKLKFVFMNCSDDDDNCQLVRVMMILSLQSDDGDCQFVE